MFSILLRCEADKEERLSAELWEQGTAGVAEEAGGLRAFFEDDSLASEVVKRFERYSPELRLEVPVDWVRVTEEAWPPILVGKRFFLTPPWSGEPTPAGRLRLEIYPGMACGTGRHPATQLCLEAMERYVRPGATVVDVGTGSGILTAAAQLLGASRVVACDIDADAVAIARERVRGLFFVGSLDAVAPGVADAIVANIDGRSD